MRYLYNPQYGFIFYPEGWVDAIKCGLTWILHPSFIRVWKGNPYWKTRPHVLGSIMQRNISEIEYPNECQSG